VRLAINCSLILLRIKLFVGVHESIIGICRGNFISNEIKLTLTERTSFVFFGIKFLVRVYKGIIGVCEERVLVSAIYRIDEALPGWRLAGIAAARTPVARRSIVNRRIFSLR